MWFFSAIMWMLGDPAIVNPLCCTFDNRSGRWVTASGWESGGWGSNPANSRFTLDPGLSKIANTPNVSAPFVIQFANCALKIATSYWDYTQC